MLSHEPISVFLILLFTRMATEKRIMSQSAGTILTYLGHSTILIQTSSGVRILIDPWTINNPACPSEWKSVDSLGKLDMILITHIHNDHAGDAETVIRANPDANIVGIYEACNWITSKGARHTLPMNIGGTQNVEGIDITMTRADHSSSFTEPDGTVVYGGSAAGYILKLEDGLTVYAAGDTALFGEMALISSLYKPTVAILPIGDLFTMGPIQASEAIRILKARQIIPIHYGTFPALTGTPDTLRELTSDIPGLLISADLPPRI